MANRFHEPVTLSRAVQRLSQCLFIFLFMMIRVHAGQMTLAWDASPSSDLGGYKIHYGQTSGTYSGSIDAGNQTSFTIPGLTDGVTYYFAATAYNSARTTESGFSNEISAVVPAATVPVASLSATTTSGEAPLTVTFTDTSSGSITSRNWDLGNGSTSTGMTASTSYTLPGTYTASLTVTGPGGTDTATATITVSSPATPPVADFSASATTGTAPMTINFTDISTGTVTAWAWQFGDGSTSNVQNPSHSYAATGTFTVTLTATGPSGSNTKTKTGFIILSDGGSVDTGNGGSTSGLVAAYGFDEVNGTTAVDASGNHNHGAITEATRITSGRFGKALRFDGVNDWVSVNDGATLDLTDKMTLEAWVYPTVTMTAGKTILVKEDGTANSAYYLYANEDINRPMSGARIGNYQTVTGTAPLPVKKWSHLASTYDGQYLRLFINGIEVTKQAQVGTIPVSAGRLRIGGNAIWGEYFTGRIDEVRVYNRALTQTEIAADASTAVAVSSPPVYKVGNETIETVTDSNPQGTAEAFQTTAQSAALLTQIKVYLDPASTATKLIAGVYTDAAGHPGTRIATGTLATLNPGSWNAVAIPPTAISSGQRYWLAILGTAGQVVFRTLGGNGGLMETSKSTALTSLPTTWRTGNQYTDGPMSAFVAGY